ncbi:uncharacterized protein LOC113218289 [Frankliniella occidentalis]|uniref:Uncharacterized protein LOC113218289 n=1 Tax=Frankliniella occidentalis TaxID=133901 RepID=A0A6J1TM42_FRAOC|nr:uncharacterized protein LOC113218289 [Frankliniella occidentalis]
MDCDICLEELNQVERVPKIVPCGHTVCLQCLEQSDRKECPTCRKAFDVPPDALLNNFYLLRQMERPGRPSRGWCSDCRAVAAPRCWDEAHDVLPEKRALEQHLQGALEQAAVQLEELKRQYEREQVVQALTLLTTESWNLTLQGRDRDHELTGTVTNTGDPLTRVMWLLVAAKAALTESRVEARGPPPAAASPPPAAPGPAPPQAWPVGKMDVHDVSLTGPDDRQQDKAALLAAAPGVPGVTRLVGVRCDADPAWSLQLLQRAAPTVERLQVLYPREAHLRAVLDMPRLRRLDVVGDAALYAQPPELPALPPGHAGLQWLSVSGLPSATTQSLLRAHRRTLNCLDLDLSVGKAGSERCGDLHSLLQQCGVRTLRRLVLRRDFNGLRHDTAACNQQRAEVRQVLFGTEVLCGKCHRVWCEAA